MSAFIWIWKRREGGGKGRVWDRGTDFGEKLFFKKTDRQERGFLKISLDFDATSQNVSLSIIGTQYATIVADSRVI